MQSLGLRDRRLGGRTGGTGLARLADCPTEGFPGGRPPPCRVAAASAPLPRVYRNPPGNRKIMRRSSVRRHCLTASFGPPVGTSVPRGASNPASSKCGEGLSVCGVVCGLGGVGLRPPPPPVRTAARGRV